MAHSRSSRISNLVLVPSTSTDTACIVGCGVILVQESSSTIMFKGLGVTITRVPANVIVSFPGVLIMNEKEACSTFEYSPLYGV